jgi:uncharacterized protein (TIGR00251 family)
MSERFVAVRVQPRARRDEVVGERDGAIVVRLTAVPAEGRANEALRRLIATFVGVPRGDVEIVRGSANRDKLVRVEGMTPGRVRRALLSHKRP